MKYWKNRKQILVLGMTVLTLGISALTGCQNEEALKNQEAYRQIGINKIEEGDYKGAAEAFQKALDQSTGKIGDMEIDISYYKAAAQYLSGDTKGAFETYQALIDYDEENGSPYYLRGCIYLKENEIEKARKDFDKALEIDAEDYELYVSIYENLMGIGEEEDAREILDKALKLSGEEPADYRERGHIYLLKGDYESARKELDKAINKEDKKALLYMAQVYEAQGNKKQAEALYKSYASQNGSDAEALNILGEMQLENGNYKQALKFFQEALESGKLINEQAVRQNEIIAYEKLKDFTTARKKMKAYLKDYPKDEQAQREFEFLQTR